MSETLDPVFPEEVPVDPRQEGPGGPAAPIILPQPQPDPWAGRSPTEPVVFLVHDAAGCILRTGHCSLRDLNAQASAGETVLEGQANDRLQKVVAGRITSKSPEEIAATERPEIPPEKQTAFISEEQWSLLQARCAALEARVGKVEQRQPEIAV